MKKNRYIAKLVIMVLLLVPMACQDQLDVENPNEPTLKGSIIDEDGFASFIQGTTYNNGFSRGANWLGDSYFSLPWGYHELMADNVGASAANNQITNIGQPLYIILDNGTKITNPTTQANIIRTFNNRASTGAGNNALYYQWSNMYALNNACNQILANADRIIYTGDKPTKVNTIKAWCYWWKGYAYAAIGSMYVAGVIADEVPDPNALITPNDGKYVAKEAIIEASNKYYNLAKTTLQAINNTSDYTAMLSSMIPGIFKIGKGGVLTKDMWIRNINTMLARNILVNKLAPFVNNNPNATISKSLMTTMTSADWDNIISLTSNGAQPTDFIFTARSTGVTSTTIFTATTGTVAAQTAARAVSSTFKISERFLQNFKPGDKRFENNFNTSSGYVDNYIYTTRYTMISGGAGLPDVKVYANRTPGAYEVIIAGSYEENALMLAEANIRKGNIETGLRLIDEVRVSQGAGIPSVAGTGLNLVASLNELVRERRVSLVFRGLSFYDSRRWGWTYDVSLGGGLYNQFVRYGGVNNTNVQINYNFVDFWDIPADETVLNPPAAGSAPVQNPNY